VAVAVEQVQLETALQTKMVQLTAALVQLFMVWQWVVVVQVRGQEVEVERLVMVAVALTPLRGRVLMQP
jgi:hypothetical protein